MRNFPLCWMLGVFPLFSLGRIRHIVTEVTIRSIGVQFRWMPPVFVLGLWGVVFGCFQHLGCFLFITHRSSIPLWPSPGMGKGHHTQSQTGFCNCGCKMWFAHGLHHNSNAALTGRYHAVRLFELSSESSHHDEGCGCILCQSHSITPSAPEEALI